MRVKTSTSGTQEVTWCTSSYSGAEGGQCVEVARTHQVVYVRDSKDITGPVLSLTPDAWASFLAFAGGLDV